MSVKISAMTAASALGGTEAFEGVQSGNTRKVTAAQIATYVASVQAVTAPIVNTAGTLSITAASVSTAGSQSAISADLHANSSGYSFMDVDFIDNTSGNEILSTSVSGAGAAVAAVVSVADHPGIVQMDAGTTSSGRAGFALLSSAAFAIPRQGLTFQAVVNIVTADDGTDTFVFTIGTQSTYAYASIANGILMEYNKGLSTSYRVRTTASSSTTYGTGGSTVTPTIGWTDRLKFVVNAAATQVDGYANGVLVGSSTATIPTLANNFGFNANMTKLAGTNSRTAQVDYASCLFALSGVAAR